MLKNVIFWKAIHTGFAHAIIFGPKGELVVNH